MSRIIPANVDIDTLVSKYSSKGIARLHEKLVEMLHLIIMRITNYKGDNTQGGYIPIAGAYFQRIDRRYYKVRKILLDEGIIQMDNHYKVGKKSMGYRISPAYMGELVRIPLHANDTLTGVIRLSASKRKQYNHVIKDFTPALRIDEKAAIDFLKADLQKKLDNPELRSYDYSNKCYKDPYQQFMCAQRAVFDIVSGNFHPHIDSTAGRLHTTLTNMRGELRPFLSFNNKLLGSIDIVGSQLLDSLLLFSSSFWDRDSSFSIFNIDPLFIDKIFSSSSYFSSFIMICKKEESRTDSDLQKYSELIKSGKFYEVINETVFSDGKLRDRKEIKAAVFQMLYTSNRFIGQPEAEPKRQFAKQFPSVNLMFGKLKQRQSNLLPILLQKIESYLVLDVITRRIAREYPSVPLFTIHDSIITTTDNISFVQEITKEELTNVFGFTPALKQEQWIIPEHSG